MVRSGVEALALRCRSPIAVFARPRWAAARGVGLRRGGHHPSSVPRNSAAITSSVSASTLRSRRNVSIVPRFASPSTVDSGLSSSRSSSHRPTPFHVGPLCLGRLPESHDVHRQHGPLSDPAQCPNSDDRSTILADPRSHAQQVVAAEATDAARLASAPNHSPLTAVDNNARSRPTPPGHIPAHRALEGRQSNPDCRSSRSGCVAYLDCDWGRVPVGTAVSTSTTRWPPGSAMPRCTIARWRRQARATEPRTDAARVGDTGTTVRVLPAMSPSDGQGAGTIVCHSTATRVRCAVA